MIMRMNKPKEVFYPAVGLLPLIVFLLASSARAEFNSGSDGSDGSFNPTTNVVVDMADHPSGIYNYSSVNIPAGVNVSFIPNANNAPVVWLVQGSAVIGGSVSLNGQTQINGAGGAGGPGGYRGGNSGSTPTAGLGPGGGAPYTYSNNGGSGSGSYGSTGGGTGPGSVYGSPFLIPLLGGSGGGGWQLYGTGGGGGGGGGAFMLAASNVLLNGSISAVGGAGGNSTNGWAGGGSGGGIRICAYTFQGNGSISAAGGCNAGSNCGGSGRIRIDCVDYQFGGSYGSAFTKGYQPIVISGPGQGAQLAILSVAGVSVSASPSGQIAIPDAVISGQQSNPVAIVLHCTNIPLNSPVSIKVRSADGTTVVATGYNSSGTQASSTATVQMTIPRGGGLIFATATTAN